MAGVGRPVETPPTLGIVQAGETAACGVAQVLKVDLPAVAAVAAVVGLQVRIPQELMAQPVAGVA